MHQPEARRLPRARSGLSPLGRHGVARGSCIAAWLVAVFLATPALGAEAAKPPAPEARAWVLVDAGDGEVLAAHAAHRRMPIASATKLMTAYVARRELALDETVAAPAYDPDPLESVIGLRAGERIRVRDLLAGLLLASGNDAAIALARGARGSVSSFVAEMNRTARKLGLDETRFANPIGLDEAGNHSTAANLATLARVLRRDAFFRRVLDLPQMRLLSGARRRTVINRNELVRSVPWVNGMKSGQTLEADHVLVGSGRRMGVTLIAVVLGAPDEQARNAGTLELLRHGFSLYRRVKPVEDSQELAAPSVRYRDERLPLLAARELELTVRSGQDVETRAIAPDQLEGPVAEGEPIGRVIVSVDGQPAGRVRLVAARSVPAVTTLERLDGLAPGPLVIWVCGLAGSVVGLAVMLGVLWRRRSAGKRGESQ